jgi:hypothetical protein
MSIRPPLRSRLTFALGGSTAAVLFLFVTAMGMFTQGGGPVIGVFGVALSAVFVAIAYWGGRSTWLRADEEHVGHYPSFGKSEVFARNRLAEIVRVRVESGRATGLASLEFRDRDGKVLFIAGESFIRPDVERFAQFLSVPLRWDFA